MADPGLIRAACRRTGQQLGCQDGQAVVRSTAVVGVRASRHRRRCWYEPQGDKLTGGDQRQRSLVALECNLVLDVAEADDRQPQAEQRCRHGGQIDTQALKPGADARLGGAQRHLQRAGHLLVRHALEECEGDRLTLLLRERFERVQHDPVVLLPPGALIGSRLTVGHFDVARSGSSNASGVAARDGRRPGWGRSWSSRARC